MVSRSSFGASAYAGSLEDQSDNACPAMAQAVVSKKFRMYLFGMQMMQLPMIAMGRLPLLRRYPTVGNIFFWAGLIWGFPLLAIG